MFMKVMATVYALLFNVLGSAFDFQGGGAFLSHGALPWQHDGDQECFLMGSRRLEYGVNNDLNTDG
tara:strand:+ start:75 stop:272 length:198 start_codon:yes stop_codon:yes gene_type:complete